MKITSRLNQITYIFLKQTKVTSVPQPNLTNTSVYFKTVQHHDNLPIEVDFFSEKFGNMDIRCITKLYDKKLGYFDQSQLFEMNGSYSKELDFSWNRLQELPNINQLDVSELNLHSNRIKQLIDSTNLSTSIEVNRAHKKIEHNILIN